MKPIPFAIAFAGLLTPLLATPPPPPPAPPPGETEEHGHGGRMDAGKRFEEAWKNADTNGDGVLSREEFSAMDRVKNLPEAVRNRIFDRLDKNKDGSLSKEELLAMIIGEEGRRHMFFPRLMELDTDHSGGVSFEEFQKAEFVKNLPEEKQREIFKRLDRDGDGQITPKDRPEGPMRRDPAEFIRKLDTNHDGAVDFEEFKKAPFAKDLGEEELKKRFQHLDRNGDGKIDASDIPDDHGPGGEEGRRPHPPGPQDSKPAEPETGGPASEK
jgi:Ca2+-binding EF-hand superfamily protein